MNGNNSTDPEGQNEVSVDQEIQEIVEFMRTIDAVRTAEYPVINEKYNAWKEQIAEDPKCIQDTVEEVDRRLVVCYVTDLQQFQGRMKDRFKHERSAMIRQAEDLSPRQGIEANVLIRVCETRSERGFDPVVRFSQVTKEDLNAKGEEDLIVPDALAEEVVDMDLQYIDPVQPEELDDANRLTE